MAQIIWDGNKNWENVLDGKQPWDREIEEKSIPENAVLIDRPDDIIKASIPYMIIPCIVCFVAIFTKKVHKSARVCHLHGENLPQYRRLSATSSAPLPPKSSAGNPTDRARRY